MNKLINLALLNFGAENFIRQSEKQLGAGSLLVSLFLWLNSLFQGKLNNEIKISNIVTMCKKLFTVEGNNGNSGVKN